MQQSDRARGQTSEGPANWRPKVAAPILRAATTKPQLTLVRLLRPKDLGREESLDTSVGQLDGLVALCFYRDFAELNHDTLLGIDDDASHVAWRHCEN